MAYHYLIKQDRQKHSCGHGMKSTCRQWVYPKYRLDMLYQWLYGYPPLVVDGLSQYGSIKACKLKPIFWSVFVSLYRTNQIHSQCLFAILVQFPVIIPWVSCHMTQRWQGEYR